MSDDDTVLDYRMLAKPPDEVISLVRDRAASWRMRTMAIMAIPHLQVDEEVKRGLFDELLRDPSGWNIEWIVPQLAVLGGERSVERLRAFFHETQDATVRGATLKALATMSDPWVVPQCAEMLRSETDSGFTFAAQALEILGSAEALSVLSQFLFDASITGHNKSLLAALLGRHHVSAAEPFLIEAVERRGRRLNAACLRCRTCESQNRVGVSAVKDIVTAFDDDKVWVTLHIVHTFSDFRPEPGVDPRKQIFAGSRAKKRYEARSPRVSAGRIVQTPRRPRVDRCARHALDDLLLGIGIVAIAFYDGLSDDEKWRAIQTLLEARKQGRGGELVETAHREVAALPDWNLHRCGEANPGTFEICWNCSEPQPGEPPRLTAELEAVLQVESRMNLGLEQTTQPDGEEQSDDP